MKNYYKRSLTILLIFIMCFSQITTLFATEKPLAETEAHDSAETVSSENGITSDEDKDLEESANSIISENITVDELSDNDLCDDEAGMDIMTADDDAGEV